MYIFIVLLQVWTIDINCKCVYVTTFSCVTAFGSDESMIRCMMAYGTCAVYFVPPPADLRPIRYKA